MNISERTERICARCGTSLRSAILDGLCEACLLRFSLGIGDSLPLDDDAAGRSLFELLEPSLPAQARVIGDYELVEEIGAGGMGVVWRARQKSLNRFVALKTIRGGQLARPEDVQRFRSEAEAAARLQHPGIVAIYEIGELDGQHFFVMELIEGQTLAHALASGPFPAERAAVLVHQLASIIVYAHSRGVHHRDLKPSNILLDLSDQPHITDFGLAKVVTSSLELTRTNNILGSPAYMAPEQASGGSRHVDSRADLYALGAILYESLTGRPPFQAESALATLRQLLEREPASPRLLNPEIPLDLETIVLKCLEKDPAKRYPTAQALADDLRRFLNNEPITARPITRTARVVRWSQRNPALATAYSVLTLLLILILIASPIAIFRINQARNAEAAERHRAENNATQAMAKEIEARRNTYAAEMILAQQAVAENNLGRARELIVHYEPRELQNAGSSTNFDPRGWEWNYLSAQAGSDELRTVTTFSNAASGLSFSPSGRWLATGCIDGTVEVWETKTWQRRATFHNPGDHLLYAVQFSPDEKFLITGADLEDTVHFWSVPEFQLARNLPSTNGYRINALCVSPDGKWLGTGGARGVCLWNLERNTQLTNFPFRMNFLIPAGITFTPDSSRFLFGRPGGEIVTFDLALHQIARTTPAHSGPVVMQAVSPDRQRLYSSSWDGIRCWSTADFTPLAHFTNHPGQAIALSPDGKTIAVAGEDRRIYLLDSRTGEDRSVWRGHAHWANSLAWSPDGHWLASGSQDQTVRLWSTEPHLEIPSELKLPLKIRDKVDPIQHFGFSPDNQWLSTVYTNDTFSIWKTAPLEESPRRSIPFDDLESLAISRGARWLAFGSSNGVVRLTTDNPDHELVSKNLGDGRVMRLKFSPNDQALAAYTWGRKVIHLLTMPDLNLLRAFDTEENYPRCLIFSPDASKLAAGWFWKFATIYDTRNGRKVDLNGHTRSVQGIAFSSDGSQVATASDDGTVRLWNATTGQALHVLRGQFNNFGSVTFSPDDSRLIAGTVTGSLHVWKTGSWEELMVSKVHNNSIGQLGFLPDQTTLISAGHDRIRVWRSQLRKVNP